MFRIKQNWCTVPEIANTSVEKLLQYYLLTALSRQCMRKDSYHKMNVSPHQLEHNLFLGFKAIHFDLLSCCRNCDNTRKWKHSNKHNSLGLPLVPFSEIFQALLHPSGTDRPGHHTVFYVQLPCASHRDAVMITFLISPSFLSGVGPLL